MTEEQLLEQERAYGFAVFSHEDAARFMDAAISLAKARGTKPVGVRVVMGGVIVCQYLMDGKDSDHRHQHEKAGGIQPHDCRLQARPH